VVVAELVPAVVDWNRREMAELNGAALEDARVRVLERDVVEVIRAGTSAYDAILLDVDNGPSALTARTNDRLYSAAGLRAAFVALRSRGLLAVWSSGDDTLFTRRLAREGFRAETVRARSRGRAGSARVQIWLAHRP
jgi:spermidine synthase